MDEWVIPMQALADPNVGMALARWCDDHAPERCMRVQLGDCDDAIALMNALRDWEQEEARRD